jgi:hypothetical protein
MSTKALTGLLEYLTNTLSRSDMAWLIKEIETYMHKSDDSHLKRYTKEEINAMLDEAERDFEAGLGVDGDEVHRELEEEFAREDAEEDARHAASYVEEEQLVAV